MLWEEIYELLIRDKEVTFYSIIMTNINTLPNMH